jgi:DNA-binding transcriptional regulator YhcF (GntR family)
MTDVPILRIDLAAPTPVYRQIADALRALLVAGRLRPGDPLPTVRELATDLGVHHNTVAEAYRLLADEGWLDLRRRRGVTILPRTAPAAGPEVRRGFRQRLDELAAEARARGMSVAEVARALRSLAAGLEE